MSAVGWGTAGFAALSWWTAQVTGRVGEYEWRGYAEGDVFPWYLVIPFTLLGACFAVVARRRWTRTRKLKEDA